MERRQNAHEEKKALEGTTTKLTARGEVGTKTPEVGGEASGARLRATTSEAS